MPFKLHFFKQFPTNTGKTKQKVSFFSIIAGLLFVVISSLLLYIPPDSIRIDLSLKVGDIVKEDIIVHDDIRVEDKEATNQRKLHALEAVLPVYEISDESREKALQMITGWFQYLRDARNSYLKDKKSQKSILDIKEYIENKTALVLSEAEIRLILETRVFDKIDLNQLLFLVRSFYERKIIPSIPTALKSKDGKIRIFDIGKEPVIVSVDQLYDLDSVRSELALFTERQHLSSAMSQFIASILKEFFYPNIIYSITLTEKEKEDVSEQVKPSMITFKAGKVILRKGDEVRPRHMRLLNMLRGENKIQQGRLSSFFMILVIIGFIALFGGKLYKSSISSGINGEKLLVVSGATLFVVIMIYRVSLFLFPLIMKNITLHIPYDLKSVFFAVPFAVGVLTISFIFNLQGAVMFSIANALVGGIICNWDFNIFIYILMGNLSAAYGIEFYQRLKRTAILKATILWMLPVNIITILVFFFTQNEFEPLHLSVNLVMGVIAAIISPILATFLIPLWELFFKLVTELKLIELTNLNLPVFREMLEKAPGTYHHSLMVASLSESVAQDMGLSPLLQRAMALYHDIGKIDNPRYFTENHAIYKNPHDNLSPRDSAKNIISHIPDGMERAEKLKLPFIVKSAITQHHGSKRVRYFYDKAREMSSIDSDELDDKPYRYQGEKPKNIENAIIMLADQVEAASKSLASPTDEEIKNVIRKIIESNIDEEQFDECEGLTFKSINIIANSFLKKLSSIYHMRISYPGFNFKEKDRDKENGDDSLRLRSNSDKIKITPL